MYSKEAGAGELCVTSMAEVNVGQEVQSRVSETFYGLEHPKIRRRTPQGSDNVGLLWGDLGGTECLEPLTQHSCCFGRDLNRPHL